MNRRVRPIKIRKDWGNIKPVTKIKDSDKIYSRKDKRSAIKDADEDGYNEVSDGLS